MNKFQADLDSIPVNLIRYMTMMRTLTKLSATLGILLFTALPSVAANEECAAKGDILHWAVDYCLYQVETDDFENESVQACLDKEHVFQLDNTCENRMAYKRKICRMPSVINSFPSVETCSKDRSFAGPTVRKGGV